MSERYAILLVDHGSRRTEANALLDAIAEIVKGRVRGDCIVESAHMEIADPTVAQGFGRCVELGATTVVVHPCMLAPGRHVSEDLPGVVAEVAASHPGVTYVIAEPLGAHAGVADAVIDRCAAVLPKDALKGSLGQ